MADYNVTARFEADAAGYINAVNQARQATEGLADSADKAGKSTGKAFDGADKSVERTGTAAEKASKQTGDLGTSAAEAGSQAQNAFDGAESGIEATGTSAESAGASVDGLGDSASQAGSQAQTAFDGVTDGIDAASISLDGAAGDYSSLGDAAQQSGSQAQSAFDGVTDGIDAAGISIDGAEGSYSSLGDTAQQSGAQAQSAFDGAATGVEAAGASAQGVEANYASLGGAAQSSGSQAEQAWSGVSGGIEAAGIAIDGTAGKYTDLGNSASVAMQQAAQGIRNHAQDMQQMGGTLTVIGGAITAVGVAAANTGIQYNDLQQRSSAALEVMAGGASEAAAQMEELNHWMQSSPFPRETWLQAQQQLMAFGMEAERVIPTLDGVQEAVAAIGGGNAEIMQLVDILGSIEGQGKITGRELQRLGQMGVDAATIIGDQMGKSGDQIRDDITAGALDAETAITALTTGMTEQFSGSAAALTDTWYGAIDLLRAAFRDLAADAFSFLVNPDGGGFLVDLANQASDLLYWLGQLPEPVLNVAGGMTLLGGAAATAAGAFFMLAPRAVEAWDAFQRLRTSSSTLPRIITGVGKAAGAAAVGFVALQAVASILPDSLADIGDAADFETQLRLIGEGAIDASGAFDGLFDSSARLRDGLPWQEIDDLEGALSNANSSALNFHDSWLTIDGLFSKATGFADDAEKDIEAISRMDEAMASMANSGDFETTAQGFQAVAEAAEAQGIGFEEVMDMYPEYIAAIKAAASERGVELEGMELYKAALGELPPELQGVADAADEAAQQDELTNALEEVGVAADGTVESLSEYLDMLFQTGLAAMSEQDAHFAYQESLRGIGDAVDELTDEDSGLGGLDAALNDTKTAFDENTEAGKVAWEAFSGLARAGLDAADAMAENGASQQEVQAHLQNTHDDLIAAANEFGITGTAAEDLARHVMGIPEGVDIETWMDDVATETAANLGTHLDSIPSELFVLANMSPDALERAFETGEAIELIDDHKLVDVVVDDQGTPGQVQSRVNNITGKTEYVLVDDNGTTTSVQQRIVNINGVDRTVWVDDNGTIHSTQVSIDGVRDGNSTVHVTDSGTSGVEGRINNTARDRNSTVNAVQGSGGGVAGWLNNLTRPRTVRVGVVASGAASALLATGGIASSAYGVGHYQDVLPRRAEGGRLPYTGLGQDMILGRNRHGVPTAWVDDGEWVIREQMSRKYHQALGLINSDHPAVQHLAGLNNGGQAGRTRLASTTAGGTTSIDYTRLAEALGDRRNVTYQANLSNTNSTMHDAVDAFQRMDMAESRR